MIFRASNFKDIPLRHLQKGLVAPFEFHNLPVQAASVGDWDPYEMVSLQANIRLGSHFDVFKTWDALASSRMC